MDKNLCLIDGGRGWCLGEGGHERISCVFLDSNTVL